MAPSSSDHSMLALPVEIWSDIISFVMEPDVAIFDDRLTLLHLDPNLLNLMLVNSFFKACVESLLKNRTVVIEAGQEPSNGQAHASVRNYFHAVPFDQGDFDTETDYFQLWNWDSLFVQCAGLVPKIVIKVTHPAELQQPAPSKDAWSDVLLHLSVLRDPLLQVLNKTRKIQVDFLPQTSIRDESPDICTFPGSPDTHWKYQPVQQVITALSYLSQLVGINPWRVMTPPCLLIARPSEHATPLELKQATVNMGKTLRDAFNTSPTQTKGRQTHATYDHQIARRYHCFDETVQVPPNGPNGQHLPGYSSTRTIYTPAYIVLNLQPYHHNTIPSKIKIIDNPYEVASDQTCTLIPMSAPNSPGRTHKAINSPVSPITAYQKRLRGLTPFPRIPELSNLYDSLSSRLDALETALMCSPVRLPTDLSFLLDTNSNGALLIVSTVMDTFQRLRIRTIREEYDLDELSKFWTTNDPAMKQVLQPEAIDGTESAMGEDEVEEMLGVHHWNEHISGPDADDEDELEREREWIAWRHERGDEWGRREDDYEDWRDDSWSDALESEDMYD